jgi:hypothetical protein
VVEIVDRETEDRRCKEIVEGRNRQQAQQHRSNEAAHQRKQQHHDQTGERGGGKVCMKAEGSQDHQGQRKAAENQLRGHASDVYGLVLLHAQTDPAHVDLD